MLAALEYFDPSLSTRLPTPRRALKGFRRLAPGASRAPLPRIALFCLVGVALARDAPLRALAYLIWFHCYFRPMEPIALLAGQVVPPVAGRTRWGVLLSPAEQQIGSKTGQLDEIVLMDWDEVPGTGRALRRRHRVLKPTERFWPFTKEEVTQEFKKDVDVSEVHLLLPPFYSFRHGGASDDFMTERHRRD